MSNVIELCDGTNLEFFFLPEEDRFAILAERDTDSELTTNFSIRLENLTDEDIVNFMRCFNEMLTLQELTKRYKEYQ